MTTRGLCFTTFRELEKGCPIYVGQPFFIIQVSKIKPREKAISNG